MNLDIDIDLGGGFEGGYEITRFISKMPVTDEFKFALHKEDFFDEIGKFFGMQDVKLGYEDFDRHTVVKTNDEQRVKSIFDDETLRHFVINLKDGFNFSLSNHDEVKVLALEIEKGIIDVTELRHLYHNFINVINHLKQPGN